MNRATRAAWGLCGLMFAATALSFLDRQVLSVLSPKLMAELHMTNTVYSRVVSAFVFSYTIMFVAGGWLVDRIGTRRGLGVSVAVWSAASAAHSLATGPWSLGAARMFLGLGEGACFPAATKGACEWFPEDRRALAIGIANGGSAFGAVLAPPLTAWLAGRFGWRGTFVATGLIGWGFNQALWAYVGTRNYVDARGGQEMSTLNSVTADFPATWISGGNADGLTATQSEPLAAKLTSLGVSVTPLFYPAEIGRAHV